MLIPLLLFFSQVSSTQFYASNAACWVTPTFYMSQPLTMRVEIPENFSSIEIFAAGRGDEPSYRLRRCAYNSCTTYQYYNANCPIIASLGFGYSNITSLLSPGNYQLTLDSIGASYTSSEITSTFINVSYPIFSFSTSEKKCEYAENETACFTNVSVSGTGQCFYPVLSATVSNESFVVYLTSSGNVTWNCTSGNYSLSYLLSPLFYNHSYAFLNSDIFLQHINSTLSIANPTNEELYEVPFALPLFNQTYEGFANISAGETFYIFRDFFANVVSFNTTIFATLFDLRTAVTPVEINASSAILSPFTFNSSQIIPNLACEPMLFTIATNTSFSLFCNPIVNYSLSNWSISENNASVDITLSHTLDTEIKLVNLSQFFSELSETQVNVSATNSSYNGTTVLYLFGKFVVVNSNVTNKPEGDEFNYSVIFRNPTNGSLSTTINFSFVEYEKVSMHGQVISPCPAQICIENLTVFANIFNSSNFSFFATRKIELPLPLFGQASQAGQQLQASPPLPVSEEPLPEPPTPEFVDAVENAKPTSAASLDTPHLSQSVEPSNFTALAVQNAFPFEFLLIPLSAACVLFLARKTRVVKRVNRNGAYEIVVHNKFPSPMQALLIKELLPTAAVIQSEVVLDSVIGKVVEFNKPELKPGEKCTFSYKSSLQPKHGKLHYKIKGKKIEQLF